MKLSAPKQVVWIISVVLGALGIVGSFTTIGFVSAYAFWFVTIGFVLLALGTALKGI